MAKEDIVIGIKTQVEGNMGKTLDDLDSKVKDVTKSIDKLGDAEEKAGKQSKQAGIDYEKLGQKIKNSVTQSVLFVEGLKMLKDAFMSNQVVADAFNGVMNALNIIFQQVVGVIIDAVKQTAESTNGFEGLTEVLKSTITIGLTPLKAAFYAIKLAIAEVQLLWEKSPFGSGDTKTIQDLEKTISETGQNLKKVGTDAVDAGVNIANNIGKAVDEVSSVVTKSVDGIKKINVEGALEQGKALVALEKTAALSEKRTQRELANLETKAEVQRQIRDDDTKSIEVRTKANEDLLKILDDEKTLTEGNAKLQVRAAEARAKAVPNLENQLKVEDALTAQAQAKSDIEGKVSEQKQNEVNLRKENIQLTQSEVDLVSEVGIKNQQNTTARIKDEEKRLVQVKADLETEKETELERLQAKIDSAEKGTQARVDAEKEYQLKKVEIDNQIATTDDQINEVRFNKNKTRLDKELQATIDSEKEKASELVAGSPARLEAEGNILQTQLDYYTEHKTELFKTDEEYAAKKKEIDTQITENEKAQQEARKQNAFAVAQETLSGFSQLASAIGQLDQVTTENKLKGIQKGSEAEKKILKESFERQKRLSIITTLINGAQAVVAALATPDPTLGVLTGIRIAFAAATTAIQVAAISSKQFDGGGGSPGPGPNPSSPPSNVSAPSTIGLGQSNIAPMRNQQKDWQKVYVVESDIRNTTNRVEVIENRSVLGS